MKRKPLYLSPSSLDLWETDRREYYIKYLGNKIPSVPQTNAMAIGSAFDAYIKAALFERLGSGTCRACAPFDQLFAASVEAHNRQVAKRDGLLVFNDYVRLGALDGLIKLMEYMDVREVVLEGDKTVEVQGVPLRGKLDMWVKGSRGSFILDWKVNGYYSKASPKPGYVWNSKTGMPHSDVSSKPLSVNGKHYGYICNGTLHTEWLDQLDTYRLIYNDMTAYSVIDQLTFGSKAGCVVTRHVNDYPVSSTIMSRYQGCWEALMSGRCFTDVTLEEDLKIQDDLDGCDAEFMSLVR